MTHKEVYKKILPETRSDVQLARWNRIYSKEYYSEIDRYFKYKRKKHLDRAWMYHLGFTISKVEIMRRKYCE